MLQDSSVDHQETWRFLKRRMEEASYILEFFDQSEGLTHNMQKGFTSAFITVSNTDRIISLNVCKFYISHFRHGILLGLTMVKDRYKKG